MLAMYATQNTTVTTTPSSNHPPNQTNSLNYAQLEK